MVERLWRMVEVLHSKRLGLTARQLVEALGASRATVYRALTLLTECGVPIIAETINGEVRHRLDRSPLPALRPSTTQLAALLLAREFLAPLEGTTLVKELDALIVTQRAAPSDTGVTHATTLQHHHPALVEAIDRGIRNGRSLRISYHAASTNRTSWRLVEPAALRMVGEHVYLIAWDRQRAGWRTFKLARVLAAHDLDEPVGDHPPFDEEQLFGHAVSIWSSEAAPIDVAVRIDGAQAWLVPEWPLHPAQRVETCADGSVIVSARVAGLLETKRWVLRWGQSAEALSPSSLRETLCEEVTQMLRRYSDASNDQPPAVVSPKLRHARPKMDETDVAAAACSSKK